MSNYEKCGAVDTQALQISILEHELAEAKEIAKANEIIIESYVNELIRLRDLVNEEDVGIIDMILKTGNKEEGKK